MNLMATFRSLLAGRRRGLSGALLIAALLLGVVTMHAMSGSANAHVGPAAAIMASPDHHDAPAPEVGTQEAGAHGHDAPGGCTDCGGHEMASAMCLMVLVALLAFTRPGASLLARLAPVWSRLVEAGRTPTVAGAAPSLHVLGISRT
ncbi:DUF6153 family protein [Cellulosimicrobium cellulans]|jgi:hypothetical protein|uniref:Uncharacterized protein n=1 Tax=Cellulosimicrobium cellulans TaxID=1710 RepID=A0A4Y4E2R1_CELCE|nr:DUF6153 family protein [Cellulosimicrobium cellulans]GED11293.1 hypothetical protein CCE02nite_32920 [Cellulosimicrobium cellulans]